MRSDCIGESVAAASRGSRLPFGLMNEERQEAFVSGWSLGFVWDLGFGIWVLDFPWFLNLLSPYVRILDFSGCLTLLINTLL